MPKLVISSWFTVISKKNNASQITNNRRGFTLVELLVVIAILAILALAGMLNYQNVSKKGRDAKRQSDLKQIQSAIEQYRIDAFTYPSSISFGNALTYGSGSTQKTYLKTVPQDPKSGSTYIYEQLSSGADYCVYANLEIAAGSTKPSNCTNASYNFAVTKP